MSTETQSVAKTILSQLGGKRFSVMTGAKQFLSFDGGQGLQFRLPRYVDIKINVVRVKLDPNDTYTVTFGRIFGSKYTIISEHSDIDSEMLQPLFRQETGLDTHL